MNSHNHIYTLLRPIPLLLKASSYVYTLNCYMHYNIQIQALIFLLFCFKFILCYTVKVVIYAGG